MSVEQIGHDNRDDELKNPGRRTFMKAAERLAAAVGVGALADQIVGGPISGKLLDSLSNSEGDESAGHSDEEVLHQTDEALDRLEADLVHAGEYVDKEHPGLSSRERAVKMVDYLGTGTFAWGVGSLLRGGHINVGHYVSLIMLTALKHELSDEIGRHHLVEETKSNTKAFGIINGTIVVAEGLNLDLEQSFKLQKEQVAKRSDKVALITVFSSLLSPVATTVGSASIVKDMSNKLAETGEVDENGKPIKDPAVMAVCTSHISNLSGFILFGDPPFIAICEKYGFKEGVAWQMRTMWPLALYTLISSTFKLNYSLATNRDGLSGSVAAKQAMSDSISGITGNIGVIAKTVAHSLVNMAGYFGGKVQDEKGIEVEIGKELLKKLGNIAELPFDTEFESHDAHHGRIGAQNPELEGGHEMFTGILEKLTAAEGVDPHQSEGADSMDAFRHAVDEENYEEVQRIAVAWGTPQAELMLELLKDFDDNKKIDDSVPHEATIASHLNPIKMYDRSFDVSRIQDAIGHNMADVVDVFPFQAGCVPFLLTAFNDAVAGLESMGLSEKQKEIVMFFVITMFSMVADNYVGCKVGLEVFPEKPELPLIAAIQGGSMTAIGNMANIAQFSLDDFPLSESIAKMYFHIDNITVALAWSQAIDVLKNSPLSDVFQAPSVKGMDSEHHSSVNVAGDPVSRMASMMRRGISRWSAKKGV